MIEQITNLNFWSYTFLGNIISDYIIAIGIFIGVIFALKILQLIIFSKLKALAKKTETDLDDGVVKIVESLKPVFYFFIAFYFCVKVLLLAPIISQIINVVVIIILVYQVTISFSVLIDFVLNKVKKEEGQRNTRTAIQLVSKISKVIIWIIAVLLVFSNFGVNVSSLIAGLGIGGIAIALAAQNVLGDLFSSFVICFDKPFVVGDFIVVGDKVGTVERIGIKTTRLKSLSGEEIIISNNQLTSAQIQNYKKMKKRRATFKFGVTYNTSSEKLKMIPNIVKNIVDEVDHVEFDRGFFDKFDDSAIVFEVVYYVDKSDYNLYTEKNQEISFGVKEKLDNEEIKMAFPTQTIYLKKE